MPDMTKEVVVDVRARCKAGDCRHALHSYMKAPPRSTFRPNCDSTDTALTKVVLIQLDASSLGRVVGVRAPTIFKL